MNGESGSAESLVGVVVDGKYSLVRLLGRGGMGEVYEARHVRIGRRLAVKFLHTQFVQRPEITRRFEKEARAAGEIEHENIAAVFDVGALPDGRPYLVMEHLDGDDLKGVLVREGRLPLIRAADLVTQACLGLEEVHRRGIVHRDLKPANLFVTRRANGSDLLKVLDFGVAKLRRGNATTDVTKSGTPVGTAHYMSPEQARGDGEVGAQSDVYALGVILYELLSGRRPYDLESFLGILHAILTQPPVPLAEACPGLPAPVYDIVRKAMAKELAERYPSVSDLARALEPFRSSAFRPSQSSSPTRSETVGALGPGLESGVEVSRAPRWMKAGEGAPRPHFKTRNLVASGAMAATCAIAAIAVAAWQTRGTTPPARPSGQAAPAPSEQGAKSGPAIDGSAGEGEDARVGSPGLGIISGGSVATSGAAGVPDAGNAAAIRRRPSPPTEPCRLTHYVDRDGNKHFSTDCSRTQ